MSLKAKINEQSEEHEALRAALAKAESDYRKGASVLGIVSTGDSPHDTPRDTPRDTRNYIVDEKIKRAYESLPDDEKLLAIHRAYNEVESSKGQIMRSKSKLLDMENKQDVLDRQIAMLQERHSQLQEQVHQCSSTLPHATTRTTYTYSLTRIYR